LTTARHIGAVQDERQVRSKRGRAMPSPADHIRLAVLSRLGNPAWPSDGFSFGAEGDAARRHEPIEGFEVGMYVSTMGSRKGPRF
jgi:hypothetical protein